MAEGTSGGSNPSGSVRMAAPADKGPKAPGHGPLKKALKEAGPPIDTQKPTSSAPASVGATVGGAAGASAASRRSSKPNVAQQAVGSGVGNVSNYVSAKGSAPRAIFGYMAVASALALIANVKKNPLGTVEVGANNKANTGDTRILLGFAIGTAILCIVSEAGGPAAEFAQGIAVVTLVSSVLINGSIFFKGVETVTKPATATTSATTPFKTGNAKSSESGLPGAGTKTPNPSASSTPFNTGVQ